MEAVVRESVLEELTPKLNVEEQITICQKRWEGLERGEQYR